MTIIKKLITNKIKLLFLNTLIIFINIIFSISWAILPKTEIEIYAKKEFIIDFNKFKIGDIVPIRYQAPEYVIKKWHLRNLPVPRTGTHWIYINENYLLIDNVSGKIYKAYNGDIFYLQ